MDSSVYCLNISAILIQQHAFIYSDKTGFQKYLLYNMSKLKPLTSTVTDTQNELKK